MRHEDKPSTPGEALEHHGVKGMRWGHRKKEETGGDEGGSARIVSARPSSPGRLPTSSKTAREIADTNASVKNYMAEAAKMDSKPSEANLVKAKQDWMNKFSTPDPKTGRAQPIPISKEKKKLTPQQKELLKAAAIGVGVVGGLYLANKASKRAMGYTPLVEEAIKGNHKGQPISAKEFNTLVTHSQMKTWLVNNHMKGDAFTREGFTLDVGHEFKRLSQLAESEYIKPTYSVTSTEDWHRYLTNFRHEKGPGASFHEVSWKLTEPVKVPALKDVLDSVHEVLKAEGHEPNEKSVLKAYQGMSGQDWQDPRSTNLLKHLKGKGYGAIIDEMDAGVIGDRPLVFFSPESATKRKSKPLTATQIAKAESLVKELQNRKT